MTASEFAFLALGLVLGIATGSAIVVVLRSRPPSHEVRVTFSHDAVPKRSSTLSADAFVTAIAEPARGGPADRRMSDRDLPVPDDPPARHAAVPTPVAIPVVRTPVPSMGAMAIASAASASTALGAQVGLATTAQRARPGSLDEVPAAAVADAAPVVGAVAVATREVDEGSGSAETSVGGPAPEPVRDPAEPDEVRAEPAFTRILHGDHRTMLDLIDQLGGGDADARRRWQLDLAGLVEATIARSVDLGVVHFPLGNPFWDTFTVEQCREIVGSLASMGHRFDGRDAWQDDEAPGYRELTMAVADAGIDPRRVRAWPNSAEIASLCRGMRLAPEDFVAERAPSLDAADLRGVLGSRADAFGGVWADWERLRPLLLSTEVGTSL